MLCENQKLEFIKRSEAFVLETAIITFERATTTCAERDAPCTYALPLPSRPRQEGRVANGSPSNVSSH